MSIQSKNWDVNVNKAPGAEGLRVSGIVTVPTPAYAVTLVAAPDQASAELRLDIVVQQGNEIVAQVLTDKPVAFFEPGPMKYNTVSIYHEDEMILVITDFLMQRKP